MAKEVVCNNRSKGTKVQLRSIRTEYPYENNFQVQGCIKLSRKKRDLYTILHDHESARRKRERPINFNRKQLQEEEEAKLANLPFQWEK